MFVNDDDGNSISLYCHVVINNIINVTPTHTIFKKRLSDIRWYSETDDDDDDDVMADAEYSPRESEKMNEIKLQKLHFFNIFFPSLYEIIEFKKIVSVKWCDE